MIQKILTNTQPIPFYAIKKGDTLSAIAKRYGVSQQALININGITDPDKIFAGDVLQLPVNAVDYAQKETPYQIGAKLFRQGMGISDIWAALVSDSEMNEAMRGYIEESQKKDQP